MSAPVWTDEQKAAINFFGDHLLLSAAAGSGKTAVLTERCFRLLAEAKTPCDPGELLVVTFTEAAAAEMKKRLYGRVAVEEQSLARQAGSAERARALRRLRLELDRAAVSTLHAFCLALLLERFETAGLDPGSEVMAGSEAETLRQEALEDYLDELYARGDAGFLALVDTYQEPRVREAAQALRSAWAAVPDPDAWRREVRQAYQAAATGHADHPWLVWQRERAQRRLIELTGEGMALRDEAPAFSTILELNLELLGGLSHRLESKPWDEFVEAVRAVEKHRFPSIRKADPLLKERVHDWHKRLGAELGAWSKGEPGPPLFSSAELARDAAELLPRLDALFALATGLEARYAEAKRQRRRLDFNDLERMAHRLLVREDGSPSEVALEYRARFRHVLVDEYQDINPLQEAILAAVSRPPSSHAVPDGNGDGQGNLFMVGDVKQSIYGFRRADCGIFLSKLSRLRGIEEESPPAPLVKGGGESPAQAGAGSPSLGRRTDLSRNFRSRPEVLAAVNAVCERWMGPETGCPPYDDRARLHPGARFPEAPPGVRSFAGVPAVLHLFEVGAPQEAAHPAEREAERLEREAAGVALRIQRLLTAGWQVADKGGYRPLLPGDVVVLLRSARNRARRFMQALLRLEIPVIGPEDPAGGVPFELLDLQALCAVLDNPRQDIPLATVLRSPLVRLSDESLARLRGSRPSGDLWDDLLCTERLSDAAERAKLERFLAALSGWRQRAPLCPVAELLVEILRATGYLEYVTGTREGRRRRANVLQLLDSARDFDATGQRGLHRFLRFRSCAETERESVQSEPPPQASSGARGGRVRILTIHKSKGLEFPVVVAPDLGKKFNFMDGRGQIVVGGQAELGLGWGDADTNTTYNTLPRAVARERLKRKTLEEELRLLYVAMSRAREHLILSIGVPGLDAKLAEWAGRPVPGRQALLSSWEKTGSMAEWLLPLLSPPDPGSLVKEDGVEAWSALDGALKVECARDPVYVYAGAGRRAPRERDEGFWQGLIARAAGQAVPPTLPAVSRLSRVAAKMGVSELKRRMALESEPGESHRELYPVRLRERPAFLSGGPLAPTARGTLMHGVLQHWDRGGRDVAGEIARQVAAGLLSADEAARVDTAALARFLDSELGRIFLDPAWSLRREIAFSLAVPVAEIEPDCGDEEGFVLVQGVIDALLTQEWPPAGGAEASPGRAGGRRIVLDFKTDTVFGEALDRRIEQYRPQLSYYRRAVEAAWGPPAPEAWIAFLSAGRNCRIE